MALNLKSIGEKAGPFIKEYAQKDTILYALGVGAGFSDLQYCYEKDLKVLPSFSIAAIFDILSEFAIKAEVNLAGILHGEQDLIFHDPVPPEGTITTNGQITNIYDKGKDKGALVIGKSETCHSNGQKIFTSICSLFCRLDGGFDGKKSPKTTFTFPQREPDFIVDDKPLLNQPLIYRLSGDIFPLHADPKFAKASGFEKPIMHGLCTHGFACRALISRLIPNEPEKARRMACRFSSTLYPGVPIKTLIWKTAEGEALWKVVNVEIDDVIIDNGIFEYGDIPKDEIRFDDRVAIITGAGAGLGRAYALELAKRGAKVVVNDYGGSPDGIGDGSSSPAQIVVDQIKKAGGEAVANYDNVASPEGGKNIVKTALDAFGTVDILINNAGILRDKSFVNMEPGYWQAVIGVHLSGAYNVTRPAFKIMKEKEYGRIVMTTSAAGLYGNFGQTNYSAAKLAIVGLMNTLKLEGKKYNIKINTVAPFAASRLTEGIMPPEIFEKSKPEFVVPMTLYLCSERCPVTGNIYNAGLGFFNRAAIFTGPSAVVGRKDDIPDADAISAKIKQISNLKNAREYFNLNDQVMDLLSSLESPPEDTPQGDDEDTGSRFGSPTSVFEAMPDSFKADAAAGLDVVFQYIITGEGGGDWFCAVKDSECTIKSAMHDKPTCTLKMDSGNFLAMMNGKLTPMQAYSSGKLVIEGDIMKSQLIEKLFRL
ncbi:MAG: SDR family NAD(P)-dependent oxidoreductase [Thermodesulfobacteriota bacterium]|nr:SDR family NAD(P)-dependent oxidoreductase [Thermodesulfobacteriota bacterium]